MSENDKKASSPPVIGGVRPRRRLYAPSGGDKMTQQCHARDTNIHAILSKYRTSGIIPRQVQKEYGDEVPADFQDAMFSGARLRSAYESLPDDERSTTTYADFLAGLAGHAEGEESPSSPADTEATADGAEGTSEASKNSERDSLPGASDQLPT